jgi:hypothetical protein
VRSLAEGKGVGVGFIAHPTGLERAELERVVGALSIAAGRKLLTFVYLKDCDILFLLSLSHVSTVANHGINPPRTPYPFSAASPFSSFLT